MCDSWVFCFEFIEMEEVVSVFRSHPGKYSLHTTRSWEFAGLQEMTKVTSVKNGDLWLKSRYGKDVVVGMLDSGMSIFGISKYKILFVFF